RRSSAASDVYKRQVKVNLALFDGSKKVSDLKPVTLARGEVVCLYVTGSGGKLAPVWVKRPVRAD
ncbi:hypothetical protein FA363_21990, partial [Pseudomonas aeruginosa]|nr:hypothetical protein [Pseudomonas aeruginosa]